VAENVGAMIEAPVLDRLADITQPTLVLFGENDRLIPNRYLHGGHTVDIAEQGAQKMPAAELVMVPECGHFVQFEKPEVANQSMLEFLAK
ncbi:MAG: alpha/beta hydrolase, partial [Candidatus Krumholzibacteria bacterium]|nr:alpha/beta hydrolase [Candidatus Krumholzibacteria bacterium]